MINDPDSLYNSFNILQSNIESLWISIMYDDLFCCLLLGLSYLIYSVSDLWRQSVKDNKQE